MAVCPKCKKEMYINENNVRCGNCGKRIYINMKCPNGCERGYYINNNNVHCSICNFRKFFWDY